MTFNSWLALLCFIGWIVKMIEEGKKKTIPEEEETKEEERKSKDKPKQKPPTNKKPVVEHIDLNTPEGKARARELFQ